MNDTKPATGRRLNVVAIDEDETPAPGLSPVMDSESWFNFWLLALLAIAAIGSIGLMFGWFKPPQQATLDKLEQTQQQLLTIQTELERVKTCVNQ